MSLANRATTKAEQAILEAGGFYKSAFESLGPYNGHWYHPELPAGVPHLGPDEALKFLADRRRQFEG